MVDLLSNLGITGSALLVTQSAETTVVRAAHNVQKIWTLPVNQLNAQELLSRETLVITLEAARWAEESLATDPHGRRGGNAVRLGAGTAEPVAAAPESESPEPEPAQVEAIAVEEPSDDESAGASEEEQN